MNVPAIIEKKHFTLSFSFALLFYLLPKSLLILWYYPVGMNAFPWDYRDILCALIPALHFLLLQIFTERNPHALQQGGFIFILQLLCFYVIHPAPETVQAFIVVWVWTLLMWKEFFIQSWLKLHPLISSLLNLMGSPFLLIFCLRMAEAPPELIPDLFLLGFMASWTYEVSRKTKAPEEETNDFSYSKLWGLRTCSWVINLQGVACLLIACELFQRVNILHTVSICIFLVLFLVHGASVLKFAERPTPQGRQSNQNTSTLIAFVIFVIPLIAAIRMSL